MNCVAAGVVANPFAVGIDEPAAAIGQVLDPVHAPGVVAGFDDVAGPKLPDFNGVSVAHGFGGRRRYRYASILKAHVVPRQPVWYWPLRWSTAKAA